MSIVLALFGALRAALRTRVDLTLENLALRQQLALLRHGSKRPQFGRLDRLLWVWLSKRWAGWREALHIVRPDTVIRWHRQGFRAFWTWKSRRGRTGRPPVASELANLVRTIALANPLWGAPRIHGELLKLGFDISQRSVARLMPRRPKPPSQTWRTFLENHLADLGPCSPLRPAASPVDANEWREQTPRTSVSGSPAGGAKTWPEIGQRAQEIRLISSRVARKLKVVRGTASDGRAVRCATI
jgi:hypothetical protein